jgi:hypothetical protein
MLPYVGVWYEVKKIKINYYKEIFIWLVFVYMINFNLYNYSSSIWSTLIYIISLCQCNRFSFKIISHNIVHV